MDTILPTAENTDDLRVTINILLIDCIHKLVIFALLMNASEKIEIINRSTRCYDARFQRFNEDVI